MSKKKQLAKDRGRTRRKKNTREERQRFLIVCQGEQTEPAYFKAFQTPGLVIKVYPTGKDPRTLVEEAKKYETRSGESFDQVWCVFDIDEFLPRNIHEAIRLVETEDSPKKGQASYNVAISNQSFELWYILHFEFLCTAVSRQDYERKLGELLNEPYRKNDTDMYKKLEKRQPEAIQNAKRLLEQYSPWDPVSCDPSTTVHLLVEELNKSKRP